MVIIFGVGVNSHYIVFLLPMPAVAAMAMAVSEVVMATTPRTTGASAPAITMTIFVLRIVTPVLFKRRFRRAPAPSTTRDYMHNPSIVVTMFPTVSRTPVVRRCRREFPAMTRWRHSLHLLYSLNFLHSLPILRWNILALQYDVVQLACFECLSPESLVIVLQLKCIQMVLVPVFLLVET